MSRTNVQLFLENEYGDRILRYTHTMKFVSGNRYTYVFGWYDYDNGDEHRGTLREIKSIIEKVRGGKCTWFKIN